MILPPELMKVCADDGDASALLALAYSSDSSAGASTAFPLYMRAAKAGSWIAQLVVAFAYELGKGVERSQSDALLWAQQAASQDAPLALRALASYYERGIGTSPDRAKAKSLLKRASELGDRQATSWLGFALTHGLLTEEHSDEGLLATELAAQRGDALALHELALRHEKGDGIPRDEAKALELYLEATRRGNPFSALRLYCVYAFGELGQSVDEHKAKQFSDLERELRDAFLNGPAA